MKKPVEIFFAFDDKYTKYALVAISSMIKNTNPKSNYNVHILHMDISEKNQQLINDLAEPHTHIIFDDVTDYLTKVEQELPLRDYYSATTYFRFFISYLYPELDKAIYIDSDTITIKDIEKLYNIDLGKNILGACHEQVMVQTDVFGKYAQYVLGVPQMKYFNAGLLLINCKEFREQDILRKFVKMLSVYKFSVAQDQDYLNVICKGKVKYLDSMWNTEIYGKVTDNIGKVGMIHYILAQKPWHYDDVKYGGLFWEYAKDTYYYKELLQEKAEYGEDKKQKDIDCNVNLLALAQSEIRREDNYYKTRILNEDRRLVLEKISKLEDEGKFDIDVEIDPPTRPIKPGEVDYLRNKKSSRFKADMAFMIARRYLNHQIKHKNIVIDAINGVENVKHLKTGVLMTCNHFNAFDSFAIQLVYDEMKTNKRFYRVIREGNYTSFPGFFGYLMKNCNTLPLAENMRVMVEFLKSTTQLLEEGNVVLIYPEQAMWWNYKKPRPLKNGAYKLAVRAKVPVVPVFITMRDTTRADENGFPIQAYTINICKPIYAKEELNDKENLEYLKNENEKAWLEVYEKAYGRKLEYKYGLINE